MVRKKTEAIDKTSKSSVDSAELKTVSKKKRVGELSVSPAESDDGNTQSKQNATSAGDDISGVGDHGFNRHKELLASIVEYSSDAIIGLSPDGFVLSWNKGARDLFRIEDKEAIGQNISSIISSKE